MKKLLSVLALSTLLCGCDVMSHDFEIYNDDGFVHAAASPSISTSTEEPFIVVAPLSEESWKHIYGEKLLALLDTYGENSVYFKLVYSNATSFPILQVKIHNDALMFNEFYTVSNGVAYPLCIKGNDIDIKTTTYYLDEINIPKYIFNKCYDIREGNNTYFIETGSCTYGIYYNRFHLTQNCLISDKCVILDPSSGSYYCTDDYTNLESTVKKISKEDFDTYNMNLFYGLIGYYGTEEQLHENFYSTIHMADCEMVAATESNVREIFDIKCSAVISDEYTRSDIVNPELDDLQSAKEIICAVNSGAISLNVRKTPDISVDNVVGTFNSGTIISIYPEYTYDDWYFAVGMGSNGLQVKGYVYKDYVVFY